MAHVISAAPTLSLTARIRRTAEGVLEAWALHREFQRTYNELDRLSDHELADIGVRRSDIADIAHQHVYGK
ncbi:DUF1127 domain-containing protein [Leisingera caerulea]|uniref:DUF1127 domain-containing protein n=1 Tax=Leisingera caerulea TaxID=506591 RepID=A0A9Q9M117_LEICA|nr:DUF1127 domain-containing protein [Leisingera caerulea]UWQ50085.1 DUF1127 domain-containing protein [Leisingera caerulea]UWQ54187.1 DUF1127 domain-containing protein [Leisingera caerulea]UWQ58785.1 DUF1127 domain-containing protein [Leisingera caerulea]UWQ62945.1 DUF1127 domain-containing protein [Leisingera caerulea]UWQ83834.1 DUF1127 domain-containing protein [Leisingera caerulea]